MEGKATEHPDISSQTEFQSIADKILEKRKKERSILPKKRGVQLPSFVASVKKEEVEVSEAKVDNSLSRSEKETARNKRAGITNNPYIGNERGQNRYRTDRHMFNWGEKKEKGKKEDNWTKTKFIRDKSGKVTKYQDWHVSNQNDKRTRIETEEFELDEKIDVGADAGSTISDFVHSKSKTFKGDSTKQRIKRALGAYYGAQKEEIENSYECVVEALIEYGFAEDAETANDMIIGLSEGFVGMIFEEYLEEKARGTKPKTTAHAYDMDETLFGHDHSKVNVHVHNEKGERTQSLSNQEFNTHKLPKGHSYNFDEFRSSKVFEKSAKPLKKMIKHLNRQKARGYDTHIVTARSDMDDQPAFAKHLSKYGININPGENGKGHTHVHRTGNLEGSDVGVKKKDTLQGLSQKHGYKKIHMYDDAAKVHKAVQNTPGVEVKTHMVKPRGKSGEVRPRSFRATETQKEEYYIDFGINVEELREVDTTPYEYWKDHIR
jgi:hypothetical protein